MARYSYAEKLDSAEQQNQRDDCCVTAHGNVEPDSLNDYNNKVNYRGERGEHTEVGRELERLCRERGDSLKRVPDELRKAPLCLAGVALLNLVGDVLCVEANPAENSLGEAVVLADFENRVRDCARKGSKVARVGMELNLAELIDT